LAQIENNDMYLILSELESGELCDRVANGELSEDGYKVTCQILTERGVPIPVSKPFEPNNEGFFDSLKRFIKERPFLSLIILSGTITILQRILQRLF